MRWGSEEYTSVKYADWITPTTAEAVASYGNWYLKPYAAATRHKHGQGIAWYVGSVLSEDAFYDRLVDRLPADAKIQSTIEVRHGVEAVVRSGEQSKFLLLINHTDQSKKVRIPAGKEELISETSAEQEIDLVRFGVTVIRL